MSKQKPREGDDYAFENGLLVFTRAYHLKRGYCCKNDCRHCPYKQGDSRVHKGSCLCGAVSFELTGTLPQPTACHCTQCRKHSGHYEAGTDVLRSAVTIRGAERVTWFRTENVRRGFCSTCGSSLFFDADGADWIGIAMGAFDTPTETKLKMHIFVANKGDYYDIADGLPQKQP